jgi:hypothetical protein
MSGLTFVVVAATAALLAAAQPGKLVMVNIVFGDYKVHEDTCAKGKEISPTTVFASGKGDVHHCVNGKLLDHQEHGPNKTFDVTFVKVRHGDRIQWSSNVEFQVLVAIHKPIEKGAPEYPFRDPMPAQPSKVVVSSPVVDVLGIEVEQQYKISFDIGGVRFDPDVVCSM